jgi:hypothetical protein
MDTQKNKIKLYGRKFELVSDPVNRQDDDVFVDEHEEGADNFRQVQGPRNVVEMAKAGRRKKN